MEDLTVCEALRVLEDVEDDLPGLVGLAEFNQLFVGEDEELLVELPRCLVRVRYLLGCLSDVQLLYQQ